MIGSLDKSHATTCTTHHDGRVLIPQHHEVHLLESSSKVVGVVAQLFHLVGAALCAVVTLDELECTDHLLHGWHRHGCGIHVPGAGMAQVVNKCPTVVTMVMR